MRPLPTGRFSIGCSNAGGKYFPGIGPIGPYEDYPRHPLPASLGLARLKRPTQSADYSTKPQRRGRRSVVRRHIKHESGAAMVEFALILPVFMIRVQVSGRRPGKVEALVFSYGINLNAKATSRYEAQ